MSRTRAILLALACATGAAAQAPDAPKQPEPKPYPQVVERVKPIYPPTLRRQQLEGEVVAWIYIDTEGKVTRVRIRKSPHELFSDAAEAAFLKWKFSPAVKDGKPFDSIAEYTVSFRLHDSDVPLKSEAAAPDAHTVSRYISAMEGAEEFRTRYWKSDRHKAFASSESGAWGWSGSRSSSEQAVQAALESCERVRDRLTSACRVVNIDGEWQAATERAASGLNNLTPFEMSFYRHKVVDEWEEPRRSKGLAVLAGCRVEADAFVKVWKSQDAAAIYAAVSQQLRDLYPFADFEKGLAAMKTYGGTFSDATFKEQSLVTRKGDEELRLDMASVVLYTARSSGPANELLLLVTLAPERGKCRVTAFQYFAPGALPPWMQEDLGRRELGT